MSEPKVLGRPREFDEDEALNKILDVFWAQGFNGTSMSDLVDATGLKKGSLYAAFGDKHTIYMKALALYDRTSIDAAVRLLTGSGPAQQRLDAFLQIPISAVVEKGDRRGCFLCNASVDQAMLDPATERVVTSGFRRLALGLEVAVADMKAGRANDTSVKAQAQHFLSVYFGLRVLAKGGHPVKSLTAAKRAALESLSSST